MDLDVLQEIGLLEGEITVYLALLQLKEATATQIAKHSGLHRTHIYDLIEKLREKGLVSHVIRNNTKNFRATKPRRILEYVKEKEEKLNQLLPELEKMTTKGKDAVEVELFKGKEGIKTVINDILNEGKDYLLFGSLKFKEIMPIYIKQVIRIVNEKGMTEKAILGKEEELINPEKFKHKYISKEYLFPNAVAVYGNKVGIFIWQQPYFVILINSKDVSNSYRKHFELLWKIAK